MRDFQTWLITQVIADRGAAGTVTIELPVCPEGHYPVHIVKVVPEQYRYVGSAMYVKALCRQ